MDVVLLQLWVELNIRRDICVVESATEGAAICYGTNSRSGGSTKVVHHNVYIPTSHDHENYEHSEQAVCSHLLYYSNSFVYWHAYTLAVT